MISRSPIVLFTLIALSVLVLQGTTRAGDVVSLPNCGVIFGCVGCYTALYPAEAQIDTASRCVGETQQEDPPGTIRIEYTPEEPLDPVGVECHEQGGGALLCEVYPLPETPGEFSYAWITSTGLSPMNGLYSAWSPSRNYHCSGANQEITVLVTSPRGTVGIATLQLDCSQF